MQITVQPTDRIITFESTDPVLEPTGRIWVGTTDKGVKVTAIIAGIVLPPGIAPGDAFANTEPIHLEPDQPHDSEELIVAAPDAHPYKQPRTSHWPWR